MWRNRCVSAVVVGTWLAVLHWLVPDRADRAEWLYLTALPLAYGHILGAFVYSQARVETKGALEGSFVAVTALTLFSVYLWLMHTELRGLVLVPMLLVAGWHIVENDLAMSRAYQLGGRVGSVEVGRRDQLIVAGATVVLAGLGLLTADGRFYLQDWFGISTPELVQIEDLTTSVLLYHTLSWILFFADRGRITAKFAGLHTAPFLVVAAGLVIAPLFVWIGSPVFYVFWSVAHAFQTADARRA